MASFFRSVKQKVSETVKALDRDVQDNAEKIAAGNKASNSSVAKSDVSSEKAEGKVRTRTCACLLG